jgi:RNA-directed DNA polymerase
LGIRIDRKRLERLHSKVRRLTRRNGGQAIEEVCQALNPLIRGWVNYFALAEAKVHMQQLDKWVRRRLRQVVWKQWKTTASRYRNLRQRGVEEYWAKRTAGTSKGNWRLSASPPLHKALNNAYWQQLGLASFLNTYTLRRT